MSEREQFEEWFSDNGKFPKAIERVGDDYKLSTAYAAWNAWQPAWQASRRAAIEDIAARFDAIASHGLPITPEFAARQVRALATGDKID